MCIWSIELIWIATYGKMEEKHTLWANFGDLYRYTFRPVLVQVMFCFSISTSVRIWAITFSFLIRFELFKLMVKTNFKENQTSSNRYLQIMTLGGPKIHSKWGYVQANFWFSF